MHHSTCIHPFYFLLGHVFCNRFVQCLIAFLKRLVTRMNHINPFSTTPHRSNQQIVKVTGEETLQIAPDQAIITLGVVTENVDPKIAQQENSQTIAQILDALSKMGIPENNIKTSDYRIDPQYNYVDGKEIFHKYKVLHMIQIKTNDIEHVGAIVDTAVKQGANSVSNVHFSLSNPDAYYNQALSLALKNAHKKALTLTETLGTSLHPLPVQIEELSAARPPIVLQASTYMKESSTPTPFKPGELTITATVRVEYSY